MTGRLLFALAGCAGMAFGGDPNFFIDRLYPVFEAAQCRMCHAHDGVASGTRLLFPERDAAPDRIQAFGRGLAVLVDRADPAHSLLLLKPTGSVPHGGGKRFPVDSPEYLAILQWIREGAPFGIFATFERVKHPARGRDGGGPGGNGRLSLASGTELKAKGFQTIPAGERLVVEMPGGGGFGDPKKRDPQRVADDVLDGLITAEEARRDYGVAIDAQGRIDLAETERLRSA